LYGLSGIGKTTLVKYILSKGSSPYFYVDCIEYNTEQGISKYLLTNLMDMHKQIIKEPGHSFMKLSKSFKQRTLHKRIHYFVFDNITRILNRKLFKKLLALNYELRNHIKVIMICDGFIPRTKYCDEFTLLDTGFVQMLMLSPSKEHLQVVLNEKVDTLTHPEVFPLFIDLVYAQYRQYTYDIVYYIYVCNTLLPIFLKDISKRILKEYEIPKLYNENFRRMAKLLINNLYLPIRNIIEEANIKESIEMVDCDMKYGLTYIEGVILIAAYIASHNPEHTDQRFFTKQKT
jgi:hypothetical protein